MVLVVNDDGDDDDVEGDGGGDDGADEDGGVCCGACGQVAGRRIPRLGKTQVNIRESTASQSMT